MRHAHDAINSVNWDWDYRPATIEWCPYTVPNNEDTHVRRYGLPLTIQICVDLHVVDTDDRRFKCA